MQSLAQSVAGNVRAEMARVRVSQTQVGRALGITQQAVSRRLKGEVDFTVTELATVAELLGVETATLLPASRSAVRSAS